MYMVQDSLSSVSSRVNSSVKGKKNEKVGLLVSFGSVSVKKKK